VPRPGPDPSGKYYFPIGFVPGEDLADYYVPEDKPQDETTSQAIARKVAEWKKDRSSSSKARCEVCGITGTSPGEKEKQGGPLEFCFGCHDFKERFAEHTHHSASVALVCYDCHVQQTQELLNPKNLDIHSYGYFLIHPDNCYDRGVEKNLCEMPRGQGVGLGSKNGGSLEGPCSGESLAGGPDAGGAPSGCARRATITTALRNQAFRSQTRSRT